MGLFSALLLQFLQQHPYTRWQKLHAPVPAPGAIVWIRQRRWRVEQTRRDGNVLRLDVVDRTDRLTFLAPFDRHRLAVPAVRPREVRPQRAWAYLAALVAQVEGTHALQSALAARFEILPHQLEPALAVLSGTRRVLIADEVGLGKTVQAGLVVTEICRRNPAARVMIVVPTTLRDQWLDELRQRFDVPAMVADRVALGRVTRDVAFGGSPWERRGVWIASLDYLKQRHVLDALPLHAWDLVVVDEAHDACGSSDRHEACAEIARRARHLVLLTATPHSGDQRRFARLVALGRISGARDPLAVFRRTRSGLSASPGRRVRWHLVTLSAEQAQLLSALGAFEAMVLRSAPRAAREGAMLLLSVLRKRALSTVHALGRSLDRRQSWLDDPERAGASPWFQPRLALDLEDDCMDETERRAISADVGLAAGQERAWLRRLRALAAIAARADSKLARVARLVTRTHEPVVIFSEFRDSANALTRRLSGDCQVAALHGGQTDVVRRGELARFLNGQARVLVATDVAGQGLNLQARARWVVSLELPWRPHRLEQRIGRVDRIGQRLGPHLTILVARHPMESALLVGLARHSMRAARSLGPGALGVVDPTESVLAEALIAGGPSPESSAPPPDPVPLVIAFNRPARALARRLLTCRAALSKWRGTLLDPHRPWRAVLRSPRAMASVRGPVALLAFMVRITDHNEAVVAQRVIAVVVHAWHEDRAQPMIDEARNRAAERMQGRLRRLRVVAGRRAERVAEDLRALERHLRSLRCPEEVQPGLFARRLAHSARPALTAAEEPTLPPPSEPVIDALKSTPPVLVGLFISRRPLP
jgi:superfamily II DNA or RNA helicase